MHFISAIGRPQVVRRIPGKLEGLRVPEFGELNHAIQLPDSRDGWCEERRFDGAKGGTNSAPAGFSGRLRGEDDRKRQGQDQSHCDRNRLFAAGRFSQPVEQPNSGPTCNNPLDLKRRLAHRTGRLRQPLVRAAPRSSVDMVDGGWHTCGRAVSDGWITTTNEGVRRRSFVVLHGAFP